MERGERLRERDKERRRLAGAQGATAPQEKIQPGPVGTSGQYPEVPRVPLDDLVDRGEVLVVERPQHAEALDDQRALAVLGGHGHERQVVLVPGAVDDDPPLTAGAAARRFARRLSVDDPPAAAHELFSEGRREHRSVRFVPPPRSPGP
ncbi:hypothetical protein OJAG_24010 [Oerskovia enterophila]|uniref:Uncharacterized protein n=1 Tax=Oerskovia enterophila TaxID=43678 RepID=A0A161XE90_9CELL|nr:hypothetical protein OJAG_24010 [Oerskovia enterophila]